MHVSGNFDFKSFLFLRQVCPHQAQLGRGLQRWWHDHPRHCQRLKSKCFPDCCFIDLPKIPRFIEASMWCFPHFFLSQFCSQLWWLYSLRRAIRHKLCWDQQLWADLWLAYVSSLKTISSFFKFVNSKLSLAYSKGSAKTLYHFISTFCELFLRLGVTWPANLTDLLSWNLGQIAWQWHNHERVLP